MRWNRLLGCIRWHVVLQKCSQKQFGIFCHQVVGLYVESGISAQIWKMHMYFCMYMWNVNKHVSYLNPKPIEDVWRCDETDFQVRVTSVLEKYCKARLIRFATRGQDCINELPCLLLQNICFRITSQISKKHVLFESHAYHIVLTLRWKQSSWLHNMTCVLENITKPVWYVLRPGGWTVCRKCPVCPYKNACFLNY